MATVVKAEATATPTLRISAVIILKVIRAATTNKDFVIFTATAPHSTSRQVTAAKVEVGSGI
jgi:hypothetical protein